MRLLVISSMFPNRVSSYSGIFVYQQLIELSHFGVETTVVSPVPKVPLPLAIINSKWKGYSIIPPEESIAGVHVKYPKYWAFPFGVLHDKSGQRAFRSINLQFPELMEQEFDLIHAHGALPSGQAAMYLANEMNIPYVVTIHGADFAVTINKGHARKKAVQTVLQHAGKVILVSSKLDEIRKQKLKVPDHKVTVIHNGFHQDFLQTPAMEGKGKYDGKIVVLSVSNLIPLKGIDYNIRAISSLKQKYSNLLYLVIGNGPEEGNLKTLTRELGIGNNVVFLGSQSREEIKMYLDLCDLFSLPSWNEAFGISYLEAMACGKPVIACEGQGISDIVVDGQTGLLVREHDISDLTRAIDLLLSNSSLRKTIGENGRRMVKKHFTWRNNAEKTKQLYQHVLGGTDFK